MMSSLGGFSQTWFAGAATTAVSALLLALPVGAAFFLAAAAGLAFSFLAASAAGLRINMIAGTEHRATDSRTDRVRVDVMGNLSKGKVSPRSSVSAGYHIYGVDVTVNVSERGKFAELGPTMTFTVLASMAHLLEVESQ